MSSCASCGSTCRNQPTHPEDHEHASENGDNPVSDESGTKQSEAEGQHKRPRGWRGQVNRFGVGAALFVIAHIIPRVIAHPLSPHDVHNGEDNDPHCVDKMPIERQNLNALGVLLHEHAR